LAVCTLYKKERKNCDDALLDYSQFVLCNKHDEGDYMEDSAMDKAFGMRGKDEKCGRSSAHYTKTRDRLGDNTNPGNRWTSSRKCKFVDQVTMADCKAPEFRN
jgi:hypothetical protein